MAEDDCREAARQESADAADRISPCADKPLRHMALRFLF